MASLPPPDRAPGRGHVNALRPGGARSAATLVTLLSRVNQKHAYFRDPRHLQTAKDQRTPGSAYVRARTWLALLPRRPHDTRRAGTDDHGDADTHAPTQATRRRGGGEARRPRGRRHPRPDTGDATTRRRGGTTTPGRGGSGGSPRGTSGRMEDPASSSRTAAGRRPLVPRRRPTNRVTLSRQARSRAARRRPRRRTTRCPQRPTARTRAAAPPRRRAGTGRRGRAARR